MDDSIFAKLGYDPVRIHTHFFGPPAPGGIARFGRVGQPPGNPPRPVPAEAETASEPGGGGPALPENPPGEGTLALAAPAGADPGGPEPGDSPEPGPHDRSGAPNDPLPLPNDSKRAREPDPAEVEQRKLIGAWLEQHWEVVEAMARAGEAPVRPEPSPPVPKSEPAVPPRRVHVAPGDRWNKPKMAEFLRQLAATHSVTAAAKAVGMSRRSAYKLRARLKGQPFDIAWEAAFRHGYDELPHVALELALEGEEVPHYYKGELKGTHRKRNPQLMVQLLKMRNREGAPMLGRYNAAAEFWSENWDRMTGRVETGSVTWDDERRALGEQELKRLDLPDETTQADQLIRRNLPDEPRGDRAGERRGE